VRGVDAETRFGAQTDLATREREAELRNDKTLGLADGLVESDDDGSRERAREGSPLQFELVEMDVDMAGLEIDDVARG
jgi:hypothetical protein